MAALFTSSRTVMGIVLLVGEESVSQALLQAFPYRVVSDLFDEHVLQLDGIGRVQLGARGKQIWQRLAPIFSFDKDV